MSPEVRYARSGDVHIAYQVVGDGPVDVVFVGGFVSHLEAAWADPYLRPFLERLASLCRLILFDRRGTGMSDRTVEVPALEERMDDVRAVMDAAGSTSAVPFGLSEGGPMSALFAATHPDRTSALVLYGSFPRFLRAPDYPGGCRRRPSRASSRPSTRLAASPGAMVRVMEMLKDIDVRDVLPTISAPTLVVHRTGDIAVPISGAKVMAEAIPGARFLELPGEDHVPFLDPAQVLDPVEEFLTGSRPEPKVERVLSTVLFTDIVASTERAAELGDHRWRELLDAHDRAIRVELERHRGREVKTMGDGFLATFDGPARGIRCACAIRTAAKALGIDVRAGLRTGEVEVRNGDVGGIAVHIGARVADLAGPGEVLVSRTVTDLVAGSELSFAERGERELKGLPGPWALYAVEA